MNTEELPLIYITCVNLSIRGVGISSFTARMKNDFNIKMNLPISYAIRYKLKEIIPRQDIR